MQKIILMFLICVFLTSCASKDVIVPPTPQVINHPVWPTPILPYRFDWKVIPYEDNIYVGLEYDQSIEFRIFLEDIRRYVKESNSTICFYRSDLKEARCYQSKKVVDNKD